MRVINKKVDKNSITGKTINIPIFLTQKFENIGLFEDIGTATDVISTNVSITGVTDSKLSEVRGFDYNSPYTVGANGVTEVTADHIKYTIGNVDYVTLLSDGTTTFSFKDTRTEYVASSFISTDANLTYVDKVDVQDSVFIERESVSVIEYFSKLRQIGSVSEIATFSNGFYKINNQTI